MIKFSVITVCLNAGNDLIETVTSTLAQTYCNFEIIVKDGFSKDYSIKQLPQDIRIRLVQENDSGIYDAMNQGIQECNGDYLIFMNAGDKFYNKDVLKELAKTIAENKAPIYYGRCFNALLNVFEPVPPRITKFFCYRSMICHQAIVYRADILKNRGYDISYKVSADKERLLYSIFKEKAMCTYVPIVISVYKDGGFSTSVQAKAMLGNEKKRMLQTYYTPFERAAYSVLYLLSFPHVRKFVLKNNHIRRLYRKIISKLYNN